LKFQKVQVYCTGFSNAAVSSGRGTGRKGNTTICAELLTAAVRNMSETGDWSATFAAMTQEEGKKTSKKNFQK
jgi:hypothetical protein